MFFNQKETKSAELKTKNRCENAQKSAHLAHQNDTKSDTENDTENARKDHQIGPPKAAQTADKPLAFTGGF